MLLLSTHLLVIPTRSDVIVPFEWLVPGAYAHYHGIGGILFYPNHTEVSWMPEGLNDFLEWTVLNRTDDVVRLNLTYFVEGNTMLQYYKSVPDGKVDILDIALAAKAYGKQAYQWGYTYNADVAGSEDGADYKIDILDIAFVAKAYGTTPDDPNWNSKADIAPEKWTWGGGHMRHHKNLFLDIDVFSRETFLDGKPLGKTCFWADPYADIDDEVVLYTMTPDEIVGTVIDIGDTAWLGWPGVTCYDVMAFQIDPFIRFIPYFDWDTGMAMAIFFQGSQPVNPDVPHEYHCKNGTIRLIYRYASIPLGTELNIGIGIEETLYLKSTNVQIGPPG